MDCERYIEKLRGCVREMRCVHCGEPASATDCALPALAERTLFRAIGAMKIQGVPACPECAELAKLSSARTLGGQRRFIAARLSERYDRLLRIPRWHAEEIEELGYNLRQAVAAGLDRRQWLERRLAWPRLLRT